MQVTADSLSYGPDAIAHTPDGKVLFVRGALPGDTVEVEITSTGKFFSKAKVTALIEPSPHRVQPKCPYAGICGGCPWGAYEYEEQLKAKFKNVRDNLIRIGKLSEDRVDRILHECIAPSDPWGYRNKIEFNAEPDPQRGIKLGMVSADEDRLIPVDKCLLFEESFQKTIKSVCGALRYISGSRDLGLTRVGIRASKRTKQVEVALWTDPAAFPRAEVAKIINSSTKLTSLVRVMTKGSKAARKIAGVERLDGYGHWEEKLSTHNMKLSAPSFFQVNTRGAEKLIELALDGLQPQETEVAADLYCGAGTFTIPLASRCSETLAIESYGPAVKDLNRNLEMHHLDGFVDTVCDETERQLDSLEDVDVVVVDPPRAGLHPSVIKTLSASNARAIAYVSCDPATLARDLKLFAEAGTFAPESITPVDLFPQTFHVETVCLLKRQV